MNRTNFLWSAVAIALTTAVAFAPALGNGFVNYDDDRAILRNPYLVPGTPGRFSWMWTTFHLGHYQPLSWLSLSLDRALGGTRPLAFHVDSMLWHALAAALLFALLLELARARNAKSPGSPRLAVSAALGALLWSVHPLRVESVAWATERRDPVSAVFLLLATIAYVRAATTKREQARRRDYALSCAALAASLLAKAWGMTFVVVLLALDLYPLRRLPLSRAAVTDSKYAGIWIEKIPFAILGAVAAAIAWLAQRAQPDTMLAVSQWPIGSRALQAAYGLCFYVLKTVWPRSLAVVYPLPTGGIPPTWVLGMVTVVAVAIAIALRGARRPGLVAAVLACTAIVSPVLGIAQSGPQAVADRYAYISAMAFSACATLALLDVPERLWRRACAAGVAVLAVFAVLTWQQTTVWRDSLALWRHTLDAGYESAIAHLDYGQALRAAGSLEPAIGEYRRALELRPDDGGAWYNLGNALKAKGDLASAESAYKQAIRYLGRKSEAQVNLGNLYYTQHRLAEAIAEYRAATSASAGERPELVAPEPFLYLGMALADNGDAAAAREPLGVALRYPSTRARAQRELDRLEGR